MEKMLRELKLESLFPKFAAQRIEPENVSALSDEELSCLGVSTIGDRLHVRGLCANVEKIILRWLQMFLANAWLFSVDVAEVVKGRKAVTKHHSIYDTHDDSLLAICRGV